VKPNLSAVYKIPKTGSGQFLEPGQIYGSPGFARLRSNFGSQSKSCAMVSCTPGQLIG